MDARAWWWVGAALDLFLLLPAFYMAIAAIDVARQSDGAPFAVAIATLFFMLPVFCILAPLAAWRARSLGRRPAQIATLLAAPWLYALFLVLFLFFA